MFMNIPTYSKWIIEYSRAKKVKMTLKNLIKVNSTKISKSKGWYNNNFEIKHVSIKLLMC